MENTRQCTKAHRSYPAFEELPDSQGRDGRHKCCGCAFSRGLVDGYESSESNPFLNELPFSQALAVRHKDAGLAYALGYETGRKIYEDLNRP